MLAIIDYGVGNLFSLRSSFAAIGESAVVTGDPGIIRLADRILLPGVGAFADAAEKLRASGLADVVVSEAGKGKPLLGVCLGMQLLFEESEESEGVKGLSVFKGKIKRIPNGEGLKIPHMGWNSLELRDKSGIFKGISDKPYVYFVHSYYLDAEDKSIVSAQTEYGVKIDAAVSSGNVFATQFHPEKSGDVGLQILRNFVEMSENNVR